MFCFADKMLDDIDFSASKDLTFRNPSSFLLAGATKSGKTTFTLNLLRNIEVLFDHPSCRHNIIYFYKEKQDALTMFKLEMQPALHPTDEQPNEPIVKHWINRLPTSDDIDQLTAGYEQLGSVVVIDDFDLKVNEQIADIFRTKCHHKNCVVILLTQNIFCQKPYFREISLNSTYLVMFKNPRDASQINCFAKQVAPGGAAALAAVYKKATHKPHSYLLFDTDQDSPEWQRVRSRVLPHEMPMVLHIRDN
jgi:hypothetical protein